MLHVTESSDKFHPRSGLSKSNISYRAVKKINVMFQVAIFITQ